MSLKGANSGRSLAVWRTGHIDRAGLFSFVAEARLVVLNRFTSRKAFSPGLRASLRDGGGRERDPETSSDPGHRRRRLQPARGRRGRENLCVFSRPPQRSDRPRQPHASWAHRQAHRRRRSHRIPPRGRCRALRDRGADGSHRAQRRPAARPPHRVFTSALIWATSLRRLGRQRKASS
jgi:hypothetical protein